MFTKNAILLSRANVVTPECTLAGYDVLIRDGRIIDIVLSTTQAR